MMVLTDRLCKKVKVSVYKVHFRIKFCSLIFKAYKDGVIYSFNPNSPINGLRQWIEKQNKLLRLSMLLNVTTHKRAAKMRLIYSYLLLNLINDILNQVELLLQAINGPVKTRQKLKMVLKKLSFLSLSSILKITALIRSILAKI